MDCIRKSCLIEGHAFPLSYFKGAQVFFEAGYTDIALDMFQGILTDPDAEDFWPLTYPYIATCYHDKGDTTSALDFLRKAIDAQSENLQEVMGFLFSEGVATTDYYDYYYYQSYGSWPTTR